LLLGLFSKLDVAIQSGLCRLSTSIGVCNVGSVILKLVFERERLTRLGIGGLLVAIVLDSLDLEGLSYFPLFNSVERDGRFVGRRHCGLFCLLVACVIG